MAKATEHPLISWRVQQDGSNSYKEQVLACTEEGCENEITFKLVHRKKPAQAVFNMARNQGWTVGKKYVKCPKCKEKKTVNKPAPKTTTRKATPVTRPMSMEDRRKIFREIDDNYDTKYIDGVTDKSIGEKLNVPWAWVKDIREEYFGPAGPDPKIGELDKKFSALEKRAKDLEETAMSLAEGSEAVLRELAELRKQLKDLK